MKAALIVACFGLGSAFAAGCDGAQKHVEPMGTLVTIGPDEFVLRDVRKDAARHLNCQVPNVSVELGAWAGSEGNITAFGCGYQLSYYLRCLTSHQCSMTVSD